jgi:hypothetical protein
MHSAKKTGVFFIICLFTSFVFAQDKNYFIESFTTANGLSNNSVKCIRKDKTGFLWIATFDGLARYDGNEFRCYYNDPKDSTSLPDINFLNLLVDKNNHVWINGPRYFCRYDRIKDRFIRVRLNALDSIHPESVPWIALDNRENIWALCESGLYLYDNKTDKFIHYHIINKLAPGIEKLLCRFSIDRFNNFWFNLGAEMYMGKTDEKSKKSERIVEITDRFITPQSLFADYKLEQYFSVISDISGNEYIFSNYGLYRLNRKNRSFELMENVIPRGIFPSGMNLAWSSENEGIYLYFPANGSCLHLDRNETGVAASSFFDEDVFWFASQDKNSVGTGLKKVTITGNNFKHYLFSEPGHKNLAVFSVLKDKNNVIWAGCKNTNFLYRISGNKILKCNFLPDSLASKGDHLRSFLEYNGKIMVGYFRKLVYWFDPDEVPEKLKTVGARNLDLFPEIRSLPGYRVMEKDKIGNLIICGHCSFCSFDPLRNKVVSSFSDLIDTYSLLIDSDSCYWQGTVGFLIYMDKNCQNRKKMQVVDGRYNIQSIIEGDSNTLWIGLLGGGLCRYSINNSKTIIYTTIDGLANNMVYNILKDRNGNLWISTNKGISLFNPHTKQFRNFGESDGLWIEEFNANAAFLSADGEMFFGGMGGIVSFYPEKMYFPGEKFKSPLIITDFRVSGENISFAKGIYEMDTVELPKGSGNVEISFACIDFRNAGKIRYRYRLIGQNSDWIMTDSRHRSVNYASLSPGNYEFQIEATDIQGNWSRNRKLGIIIPPFFYQTFLFKIITGCFIFSVFFLFYRMLVRQIKLQEKKKHEELKLESLRGQMNPHFLFNSLNSINYFISASDKISANRYITDFSRLIRAILTNSANEFIPMEKEIESLGDYFRLEHLRFGDKFDYEIIIDPSLNPLEIEIMPTMVQPFVENAIWHGVRSLNDRKGMIRIIYKMITPDRLVCIVEDDGIGRKTSEERKMDDQKRHRSRGIAIIRERLKLFNSLRKSDLKIVIEDLFPVRPETGTRVIIEIPVKQGG